jgi:hypothetical protein
MALDLAAARKPIRLLTTRRGSRRTLWRIDYGPSAADDRVGRIIGGSLLPFRRIWHQRCRGCPCRQIAIDKASGRDRPRFVEAPVLEPQPPASDL